MKFRYEVNFVFKYTAGTPQKLYEKSVSVISYKHAIALVREDIKENHNKYRIWWAVVNIEAERNVLP